MLIFQALEVVFFFVTFPNTGFEPNMCTFPGQEIGCLGFIRDVPLPSLVKQDAAPVSWFPCCQLTCTAGCGHR